MTDLFEHNFDEAHSSMDISHHENGFDFSTGGEHIHAEDNIFGGHDYYHDGVHEGHSEANIFGGHDIYDEHHQFVARTMDDGIGGHSIFSHHGFEGTFHHGDDGHDSFAGDDGHITHFDNFHEGNASHIMQYEDPLAHIDGYVMPELLL